MALLLTPGRSHHSAQGRATEDITGYLNRTMKMINHLIPKDPIVASNTNSVHHRQQESLYHALGPLIADALAQPDVVEIMANPDGKARDRLTLRVGLGMISFLP